MALFSGGSLDNQNPAERLETIQGILDLLQELSLRRQGSPEQILAEAQELDSLGDLSVRDYLKDLETSELKRIKEDLEGRARVLEEDQEGK